MNMKQLKIKQAVLRAVRKLSGAAFSKELGDYYITYNFGLTSLSVVLWLDHEIVGDIALIITPKIIEDIPTFERKIEAAIAKIFNHVANNSKG